MPSTCYLNSQPTMTSRCFWAFLRGWYSERDDPQWYWPNTLAPLLTRLAQQSYYTLADEDASDYLTLKDEILAHCGLSPTIATAKFQCLV